MEAVVKLIGFSFIGLALLVGGITGFAGALKALVYLAIGVAVLGLAGFLILRSRLVAQKMAGLVLLLVSLPIAWYWNHERAPRPWREERATVAAISGPTALSLRSI